MKTYTCLFPLQTGHGINALVLEAVDPLDAVDRAFKQPALHNETRTNFVLPGDFRAYEMSRDCLQEVGYFLSGGSHLSKEQLVDYVDRTLNALETLEK